MKTILASILVPAVSRALESARRVSCASNMRQIGQGMRLFGTPCGCSPIKPLGCAPIGLK